MTEPYYTYPTPEQAPPARKGLGISAMVLGIVSIVLAFIPFIGLVSFLLGPLAVILGIVAIVKHRGEGQGIAGVITGAIGTIIAIVGILLTSMVFDAVEEESERLNDDVADADPDDDEEVAEVEEEVQDQQEEIAEEREEAEETGTDGDQGTRENPLAPGETVSNEEWEVTIHGVTPNADDEIAAENPYNDPAPEGMSYMMVDMSATYLGEDSDTPMMGVELSYVTTTGETIASYDYSAVTPDAFESFAELYTGGTETGNVALVVPTDDDGTLRVRLGFLDTQDFFFETSE
ncbi:DUF4190 domain-containing protein [Nesterenkonia haasae]|uniref:DUF4190 domain-containing protein n=1 Tax=Nesterenkonia haasae TaxID=2587813 RepID=UPI0013912783|nr:DUF4190 domain-containing protein [Nesterenkonia haasae]NDK30631.1 DUF4190 domain-containing protein [Nesterenkonia haasae]